MGLLQNIKLEIDKHLPLIDLGEANTSLLSSDSPIVRGAGDVLQMWRQTSVGFYPESNKELMKRSLQIEQNQANRIIEDRNM